MLIEIIKGCPCTRL